MLHEEARARLVMASVQQSNPQHRNKLMVTAPQMASLRVASLDVDISALRRAAQAESAQEQAIRAGLDEMREMPRDAPEIIAPEPLALRGPDDTPRPRARAASLSDAVAVEMDIRLSTQGAGIAPLALGSVFAPQASLRPTPRPAGLERRVVQYTRQFLRNVAARTLDEQEACLATAIYHEARGESIEGQFAVAEVILNRVASRRFPNSICAVVYQGAGNAGRGCQFSFACDGQPDTMPNRRAATKAQRIAQVMADGGHRGLTQGALYFHTTAVNPGWAQRFTRTSQIGAHLFYRG